MQLADDEELPRISKPLRIRMTNSNSGTTATYTTSTSLLAIVVNLCKTNICSHLKQCRTAQIVKNHCLGYLENSQGPDLFKHMLYSENAPDQLNIQRSITTRDLVSIEEILRMLSEDDVDPVDQLTLAVKLTKTVLQFHSTAWLKEYWGLADLALFDERSQLSKDSLCTLHLTAQMPNCGFMESSSTMMEGIEATRTAATLHQSRQNSTMASEISRFLVSEKLFCRLDARDPYIPFIKANSRNNTILIISKLLDSWPEAVFCKALDLNTKTSCANVCITILGLVMI